jgi:hypothetical protein
MAANRQRWVRWGLSPGDAAFWQFQGQRLAEERGVELQWVDCPPTSPSQAAADEVWKDLSRLASEPTTTAILFSGEGDRWLWLLRHLPACRAGRWSDPVYPPPWFVGWMPGVDLVRQRWLLEAGLDQVVRRPSELRQLCIKLFSLGRSQPAGMHPWVEKACRGHGLPPSI